jgi:hypothetical protein
VRFAFGSLQGIYHIEDVLLLERRNERTEERKRNRKGSVLSLPLSLSFLIPISPSRLKGGAKGGIGI